MPFAVPTLHMRLIRIIFACIICLTAGTACTLPSPEAEETDEAPIISDPEVLIVAPVANAIYREGVSVNIQAAINNAIDIARVDVFIDGVLIVSIPPPAFQENAVFTVTQTWPAEGAGEHTVGVTAFRADGTTSDPASVTISVIADSESADNTQPATATPQPTGPTATPVGTPPEVVETATSAETEALETEEPTQIAPAALATSDVPLATFNTNINVRSGPGTEFQPPIGSFLSGQSTRILATNLSGSWLKVEYNSGEGWVFASLTTTEGDLSTLPREVGPPTPIPTTIPTAIPTNTPVPQAKINLIVEGHFVNPSTPNCGEDFTVGMSIRNAGDVTTQSGLAVIRDIHKASGDVQTSSAGGLVSVSLDPGTVHYVEVQFNVSTYVNEVHRIEFIADVNNEIRETNEDDNLQAVEYTLPNNCN